MVELKEIKDLIIKEINTNCCLEISEFLSRNNLNNVKNKDIIKLIEKSHDNKLIIDVNEENIYSYDLVYNYCKLKLFYRLTDQKELDLGSEDFQLFKHEDLIGIFT